MTFGREATKRGQSTCFQITLLPEVGARITLPAILLPSTQHALHMVDHFPCCGKHRDNTQTRKTYGYTGEMNTISHKKVVAIRSSPGCNLLHIPQPASYPRQITHKLPSSMFINYARRDRCSTCPPAPPHKQTGTAWSLWFLHPL